MNYKQILISGFLLWMFSVIGTTLVAVTQQQTEQQILDNEKKFLLRNLYALLPKHELDNDMTQDTIMVEASALLGTEAPTIVYRARKGNKSIAAIFNSIAPDGYSGKIHLLIGIYYDGRIAGVRVVKHNETPGLGDAIEVRKSNWILGFDTKSLISPAISEWKVKRDDGHFDQMTGATITPRAIVKAVKNTLLYFNDHKEELFQ